MPSAEHDVRALDLQLESETAFGQPVGLLEEFADRDDRRHLVGGAQLGHGEHEPVGHPAGAVEDRFEGTQTATAFRRLQPAGAHPEPERCTGARQTPQQGADASSIRILGDIVAVVVAVLEVHAQVLNGCGDQQVRQHLGINVRAQTVDERCVRSQDRRRFGRPLRQRRVVHPMCRDVYGMDRLTPGPITRVEARQRTIDGIEDPIDPMHRRLEIQAHSRRVSHRDPRRRCGFLQQDLAGGSPIS